MATGLLALLDDVAAIAKVAAATLDDVAGQAARAGTKAAGVVIDDAAVTPRYVTGFAAERELPIVWKIALGSLKNKLLYLLPVALLLSAFAPWAITPLLMLGGFFLCYEGAEKVLHALSPQAAEHHEKAAAPSRADARLLEDQKVNSAIKTDFILSAEIMALTLSTLAVGPVWLRALILALVGLGLTALVYGGVGLIVKADDVGVSLAANPAPASSLLGLRRSAGPPGGLDRALAPATQLLGRGLVRFMPWFLRILAVVGTAAMVWVGGGIILHGLEGFGLAAPAHLAEGISESAVEAVPHALAGAAGWLAGAAAAGVVGLAVGALLIPLVQFVVAPLFNRLRPAGPG
ncbi:DUF808 domain-containing protein [Teichococcus vastitatis]|uniref:DUF808 domain-containing protein n=1 Tax=Teichococcus vastitatis TaxID=2307076 RepID=A0ABS9WDN8_9PROT|nr:DUF808 domain-containing protein [Pseudoroseomonas vastitatis]MCI0756855.1 DUF808 domain-containing protein [Pseudoroseomonas vastitatis]